MPPIPPSPTPRIVIYYQTQHHPDGSSCSILPIITEPNIAVTHVNLAAIHLNDPPGHITLNNHVPHDHRYVTLWAELRVLQASGIKVLGMLGGAGKGSFTRLDLDEQTFEAYYGPLRDFVRERGLDGLDLDVEEPMTLAGIIRLIDRLKSDFGDSFIITLAPVAAALMSDDPKHNLSGFSYEALEVMRGTQIAWYNTQFYCGWGDLSKTAGYDFMVARGYPQHKIVIGMVTNPSNGSGWVPFETFQEVLITLKSRYPGFGGVMGWEYFNSLPGDRDRPWEWATFMTKHLRAATPGSTVPGTSVQMGSATGAQNKQNPFLLVDRDLKTKEEAPLPKIFDYYSDGSIEE
ncbi:glycoside hydrolase family 18 protein [Amylocarpus encephaloides]|uniref:chitinase n=1 Tax=Amylocarpus encephaloides TaxID=45428 RepID=A0A9P7Y9Y2_9HELO|nr:glycoside hydrolase family 18 protein [Amylocarpus encephaloides]